MSFLEIGGRALFGGSGNEESRFFQFRMNRNRSNIFCLSLSLGESIEGQKPIVHASIFGGRRNIREALLLRVLANLLACCMRTLVRLLVPAIRQ